MHRPTKPLPEQESLQIHVLNPKAPKEFLAYMHDSDFSCRGNMPGTSNEFVLEQTALLHHSHGTNDALSLCIAAS